MKFKSFFSRYLFFLVMIIFTTQLLTFITIKFIASPKDGTLYQVGIALIGIVIAMIFAKYFSLDISRPITELIRTAKSVEHGEKREPLNLDREDEFLALQESMNRLIDRDKAIREANQDPLTGLANRRYLMQRLDNVMEHKLSVALMFLDLDGFKPINDEFGHDVGDEALRIVSDRLSACVRENDVLSRLGGDEFVIMLVGIDDQKLLEERAKKVLEMINMPLWISGNRLRMGASIGVAVAPKDAQDSESLITAADESMYAAKQGGKNAFRFYS